MVTTVIGIESQDGKRKTPPSTLEGCYHRFSSTVEQRKTFRPPGGNIRQRDRIQAATLQSPSTMGHEIHLQKTRLGFIPIFANVRTGICCLSNGPALVVERPWRCV